MSGNQASLPLAGSVYKFAQHGKAGAWISELLPHTAKVADDLCIVRSMFTEAINHDPAITFLQTGSQISGRPSIGVVVHYGLGSDNENLPAFVVLITPGKVGPAACIPGCGAAGFCLRRIKACSFVPAKTRCCIFPIPPVSRRKAAGAMLDRLRELHETSAEPMQTRKSTRASRSTRWLTGCRPACRT